MQRVVPQMVVGETPLRLALARQQLERVRHGGIVLTGSAADHQSCDGALAREQHAIAQEQPQERIAGLVGAGEVPGGRSRTRKTPGETAELLFQRPTLSGPPYEPIRAADTVIKAITLIEKLRG